PLLGNGKLVDGAMIAETRRAVRCCVIVEYRRQARRPRGPVLAFVGEDRRMILGEAIEDRDERGDLLQHRDAGPPARGESHWPEILFGRGSGFTARDDEDRAGFVLELKGN